MSSLADNSLDQTFWLSIKNNFKIIGVDEAGRGCLCGPVYAAAVCFKADSSAPEKIYKDSKLLTPEKREVLFADILDKHWVGIGFATSLEVDNVNILQASLLAMNRAVISLKKNYEDDLIQNSNAYKELKGHVFVDGNQKIRNLIDFPQTTLIKGDQLVAEISAASIVAKVSRDRYLDQLDLKYPEYEFRKHKGYGTQLHKEKIKKFGPCPEHRTTFKGVREFLHLKNGKSYQGIMV